MNHGYIKLWRQIMQWEWYDDSLMVWFFIRLLLLANWENKQWHGITIKRGQFVSSLNNLRFEHKDNSANGKITKLSLQTVRTMIKRLNLTGEITCESTNQYTIYTIVKYNTYQSNEDNLTNNITSEITNQEQTGNKRVTTTKEVIRNKKKVNKSFIKPTIGEVVKYCKETNSSVDGEYFWHHYEQTNWIKPNGQSVLNWKSTVKTWEKRNKPENTEGRWNKL